MQAALDQARADAQRRRDGPPEVAVSTSLSQATHPSGQTSSAAPSNDDLAREFASVSKRRWTPEERARMQAALDEARAGAPRREAERVAASLRGKFAAQRAAASPPPEPVAERSPPKRPSIWSAEYRAQMQAALAAAQRRFLQSEATAAKHNPTTVPSPVSAPPTMLEGKWTDSDRGRLVEALKALRDLRVRTHSTSTRASTMAQAPSHASGALATNATPHGEAAAPPAATTAVDTKVVVEHVLEAPQTIPSANPQPVETKRFAPPPSNAPAITVRFVPAQETKLQPPRPRNTARVSDEPVLVFRSDVAAATTEFRLPPQPKPVAPRPKVVLDLAHVNRILRDDASSSQLLAGIFSEDEHDAPSPGATAPVASPGSRADAARCLGGLDAAHSELMEALLARSNWTRPELLALAARLDLMLDGALERINEAALNAVDAVLVEDDGDIQVDEQVARQVRKSLKT